MSAKFSRRDANKLLISLPGLAIGSTVLDETDVRQASCRQRCR